MTQSPNNHIARTRCWGTQTQELRHPGRKSDRLTRESNLPKTKTWCSKPSRTSTLRISWLTRVCRRLKRSRIWSFKPLKMIFAPTSRFHCSTLATRREFWLQEGLEDTWRLRPLIPTDLQAKKMKLKFISLMVECLLESSKPSVPRAEEKSSKPSHRALIGRRT